MEDQEIEKLEEEVLSDLEQEIVEEEEREPDEIELQAKAQGWKPGGVKSAAEFLRAGPLYKEIEKRGQQIDSLKKSLDAILEYNRKQEEVKRQQELEYLNNERLNAIQQGSVERFQAVEQEISKYAPEPEPVDDLQTTPESADFIAKYKDEILSSDEDMAFIDQHYNDLLKYNLSPKEHFDKLEALYLDKKDRLEKPIIAVETSPIKGLPAKTKKSYSRSDLNKDQREVLRLIVDNGIMTEKEYIASLVAQGDL